VDFGGPKEPCIRWEVQIPHVKGNSERGNVICMANAWLKEQDQQFFYNGI